jgi:hypothetical protein
VDVPLLFVGAVVLTLPPPAAEHAADDTRWPCASSRLPRFVHSHSNTMRRRLAHVPVLPDRVLIRPLALRMARVTHTVPTIVRRTLRPVTRPWR